MLRLSKLNQNNVIHLLIINHAYCSAYSTHVGLHTNNTLNSCFKGSQLTCRAYNGILIAPIVCMLVETDYVLPKRFILRISEPFLFLGRLLRKEF